MIKASSVITLEALSLLPQQVAGAWWHPWRRPAPWRSRPRWSLP